jgi:DNA-binding transcriptional MerR regulator
MNEADNIVGAFSEDQAARLSGVSLNQLRRWDADGFFCPSYSDTKGVPFGRIYSFRDIVSLRVLNDLRNNKRISLAHLRDVSRELSHLGDEKWTATTLYVLGRRVVFDDPRTKLRQEVVTGQRVFDIPLRVVISSTRRAVQGLNDRDGRVGQIVRARFTAQNEPVIAGTRVSVTAIREFAEAGYSVEKIVKEYPGLTEADVAAALAFSPEPVAA